MILVDTSVWIDHLRSSNPVLVSLLENGSVLAHSLVIEELACGHIRRRDEFIGRLHSLPVASVATHAEILDLISEKALYGIGIGAVDVHLIASAMLGESKLWTKDKALARAATRLGLEFR